MDGNLRFNSLSSYQRIEDGAVRGDANEGSVYTQPETGLVVHNLTQRRTGVIPGGELRSVVKSAEIFVLCASNCMKGGASGGLRG